MRIVKVGSEIFYSFRATVEYALDPLELVKEFGGMGDFLLTIWIG